MKDLFDIHTHTIASGHAYNTLYEMVKAAADNGLTLFGSSDHAPSIPGACHEMYFRNFSDIPREIYGVKLIMGSEVNIMDYDGSIDLSEKILDRIDYAIASIHELCYKRGNKEENTSATIGAIKNPYVTAIGHPDSSKLPLDYEAVVKAAKEYHTLLEVNNSSLTPGSSRLNARENYITMLNLCKQHGVSVILNSDAHSAAYVGSHIYAHQLLEELQFPEELVVNTSLQKLAEYIPCVKEFLY